jgi:HlyD family secretion protein
MTEKSQHSNIMLAFFTLAAVIVIVSIIGFFTLGKGPEIIQGQAEATEYRVSSKVPGRILKFLVDEGEKVKAGDTLAILEAPDVQAKLSQAQAAEQAAQALNEKAIRGTRSEQLQAAFEMWQKAKAGLDIAEKSYNRVNRLYEEMKQKLNMMLWPQQNGLPKHNTQWLRMVHNVKTKQWQQLR